MVTLLRFTSFFFFVFVIKLCSSLLVDGETDSLTAVKLQLNQLQGRFNQVVETVNNECALKCPARMSVAFMAELSHDIVNAANGRVVVFDNVHTNVGNAYNSVHGIFTAPVNGTYNFNLIASSPNTATDGKSHGIHLNVKKNSITVGYIFLDDNHDIWLRRSTDITQHLVKGDEIWVEMTVFGTQTLAGGNYHTHLSGFLIQED